MKRLLFPAFVVSSVGLGLLAGAGCDPDLGIVNTPGTEGGAETGPASEGGPVTPAEDGGGTTEGGPVSEAGPEAGPAEHTIDGTNDFAPGEKFATSSANYNAFVAWDDKRVYFGMSGADIAAASATRWVLVYVDGNPGNAGTPTGISYGCSGNCTAQQANLPFNAGYHLRWKLNGSYSNLQKWDGAAWAEVGPIGSFVRKNDFMEISILRTLLGSPAKLKVHMTMLVEEPGAEWTYAGTPSSSFTDGKAPAAYTKFYEFDLADRTKAPNTYPVKP